MNRKASFEVYGGVEVAPAAWRRVEERNKYGSVPGLADEELADPGEVARCVAKAEWEPILSLPRRRVSQRLQPNVAEDGSIDWGAFGTVDFDRLRPERDGEMDKIAALKERLADVLILVSIVKQRVRPAAKYLVLRYLQMEVIDLEHIRSEDMRALGRLWLRAKRLQREIERLKALRAQRQELRLKAFLGESV